MKNFINYFYNIFPTKIFTENEYCYFFVKNSKIYVKKYYENANELENLLSISNTLYENGVFVNTFIFNNKKECYTKKDKDNIILLKVNDTEDELLEITDILNFHKVVIPEINDMKELNIYSIWAENVDKLEEKMIEYNKEYPIIQNSINYYIGLSENAIQLMNESKKIKNNKIALSHNIKFNLYSKKELYNPLNFVVANPLFDVANYIKYKFFKDIINYDEVESIILNNIYDEYDIQYFFSNLLFPNYYFDTVKDIIDNDKKEKELNNFINKINKYELFLYECKEIIKKKYNFPNISWINGDID